MQDFAIDIIEKLNTSTTPIYIRMTTFVNNSSNPLGSFDEELTLKENASLSLTFSMYKYVNEQLNPYISFLVNDRLLQLTHGKDTYHFIITNIVPTVSNNNVKYTYTCQDELSYNLSRRNVGMNFTTDDSEEYKDIPYTGIWGSINNCGPKTIDELINKLFEMCNIKDWKLDEGLNSLTHPFPNNLYDQEGDLRVTLTLTNTNPFNIIVEIAKLFNAVLKVDYTIIPHIISFINKDLIQYRGFDLHPSSNLQNFSYSEKGDALYNIMHVVGGEDADGNYISMMPTMPDALRSWIIKYFTEGSSYEDASSKVLLQQILSTIDSKDQSAVIQYFHILKYIPQASSFLYDFSYWKENHLISEEEFQEIEQELALRLRNINLRINAYTPVYYKEKSQFDKLIKQEEELIALIAAEDESIATITEENANSKISFYNTTENIVVDNNTISVIKLGIIKPVQNTSQIVFQYGYYLNTSFAQYLPDWATFLNNLEQLKFYIKKWNGSDWITENINIINDLSLSSISIKVNTNVSASYNITLYCNNLPLLSKLVISDLSLEQISINAQENYKSQLINTIWTDDYITLYRDLYGKNYIKDKIQSINNKITENQLKRQEYIQKVLEAVQPLVNSESIDYGNAQTNEEKWDILRNKYGNTISAIDDYAIYIDYAYNKSLITNIETYIGGPGTRIKVEGDELNPTEYYNFKGYYIWYLEELQQLQELDDASLCQLDGDIYNILYGTNGLISKQKQWWTNFYINHNHCIRETTYSDTNQLDNEGLYGSAIKQFDSYKQPNQTFSASYINSNLLVNYSNSAQIGDVINIYQPELFNNENENIYVIQILNDKGYNLKNNKILNASLAKPNGINNYLEYSINIIKIINDSINSLIYFTITSTLSDPYICTHCFINGNKLQIISLLPYKMEKPVQLQITGITKDLRSTTEQLIVTKYNTINSIVDKILYSIKNQEV